ncbi:STAS domain-containing protein [Mycolicibacterium phlei]|jgi:anti-anti-sigma factor
MATPLQLHTEQSGDGTALLRASGELDLSNIAEFTDAIEVLQGSPITVDLSGVEYLDSAAINTLFGHAGRIRRIIANSILMPVLRISGLTEVAAVEAAG